MQNTIYSCLGDVEFRSFYFILQIQDFYKIRMLQGKLFNSINSNRYLL